MQYSQYITLPLKTCLAKSLRIVQAGCIHATRIYFAWLICTCVFAGNLAVAQTRASIAIDSTLLFMEGDIDSVTSVLRNRGFVALPPDSIPLEFFDARCRPRPKADTSLQVCYFSLGENNRASFTFYQQKLCKVRLCEIVTASEDDILLKIRGKQFDQWIDVLLQHGKIPLCDIVTEEDDILPKIAKNKFDKWMDVMLQHGETPHFFYQNHKEYRVTFGSSNDLIDYGHVIHYTPTVKILLTLNHSSSHLTTITVERTNYLLAPSFMFPGTEYLLTEED